MAMHVHHFYLTFELLHNQQEIIFLAALNKDKLVVQEHGEVCGSICIRHFLLIYGECSLLCHFAEFTL